VTTENEMEEEFSRKKDGFQKFEKTFLPTLNSFVLQLSISKMI
jgi:hypothetical protein